jgi:branched-chain amino acid transport system ATP-binding protein
MELSVAENLRIGAMTHPGAREAIGEVVERFPILGDRSNQLAGSLSGGERQLLAISAALLMRPKVLLLDEPTTGLSPKHAADVSELIVDSVGRGLSVAWVVEQMPEIALKAAERAYFLEGGQVRYEGDASHLLSRDQLMALMLGTSEPPDGTTGTDGGERRHPDSAA